MDFVRLSDYDLDEPLTAETIAEITGARVSFVIRLVQAGILETINETAAAKKAAAEEPVLLPRRAVLQLRQMQRLRRDLGVNSAGASVILDLVKQMEEMKREIARMQAGFSERRGTFFKGVRNYDARLQTPNNLAVAASFPRLLPKLLPLLGL